MSALTSDNNDVPKGFLISSASNQMLNIKQESENMSKWRGFVFIMLLLNAAIVLASTYVFLARGDTKLFQSVFDQAAKTVILTAQTRSRAMIDTIETLRVSIEANWDASLPFVTFPQFESFASRARLHSFTEQIILAPIIHFDDRIQWEKYARNEHDWINESIAFHLSHKEQKQQQQQHGEQEQQEILVVDGTSLLNNHSNKDFPNGTNLPFTSEIFTINGRNGSKVPSYKSGSGPYAPVWQVSPPPTQREDNIVNLDVLSSPILTSMLLTAEYTNSWVLSQFVDLDQILDGVFAHHTAASYPSNFLLNPIMDTTETQKTRGFLLAIISWETFLSNMLPDNIIGIYCIVHNSCGQALSFLIDGGSTVFLGEGDHHDPTFNDLVLSSGITGMESIGSEGEQCNYRMDIYPSNDLVQLHSSNQPRTFTVLLALMFFVTGIVFFVYTRNILDRQQKVLTFANRTSSIVSSLFPSTVRDRILGDAYKQGAPRQKLSKFLQSQDGQKTDASVNKPIADLFPSATVMFADMVGFTAWSSVREPTQVFILLETVYHEFDDIANRRGVFKVETIGDCYVAVAGLPDPCEDHAIVMSNFAHDCLTVMKQLTKKLEVNLGPDTGELTMRFGLHSGSVTAGVLRGQRSRFQLFGDTVNTAARMESNGLKDRIHISQQTADLLIEAGKGHWVTRREEKVLAKGKGELQTFWLEQKLSKSKSFSKSKSAFVMMDALDYVDTTTQEENDREKHERLIDWNVDQLARLLKQIVARRKVTNARGVFDLTSRKSVRKIDPTLEQQYVNCTRVWDEVEEAISLPKFDFLTSVQQEDPDSIELDREVLAQLHDYVTRIGSLYSEHNAYHCFEHASHVTMSVIKLLSRILTPGEINNGAMSGGGSGGLGGGGSGSGSFHARRNSRNSLAIISSGGSAPNVTFADLDIPSDDHTPRRSFSQQAMRKPMNKRNTIALQLHDYSFGITSDPLTQFSVVFSALIHDLYHTGVPNFQLAKEQPELCQTFSEHSLAEQKTICLAWDLLMESKYDLLRQTIYSSEEELQRFRKLVVTSVLATDIFDNELKSQRNARWEEAFSTDQSFDSAEDVNKKATIVIEHLMQASDVSHTMQHWHVYRKWNSRLFKEQYEAYRRGRADRDPITYWHEGELAFFDFYVIPLANKLKECGVFGVYSDEYLSYAMANRAEWELKGREIVAELAMEVKPGDAFNTDYGRGMDGNGCRHQRKDASQGVVTRLRRARRQSM